MSAVRCVINDTAHEAPQYQLIRFLGIQSVYSEANDSLWRTLASATQALWPTFGNHQIYQLQPAETESVLNVLWLLLAETKCPPKLPIYPHSAPKPKPKPKFGRPLLVRISCMFSWCRSTSDIMLTFVIMPARALGCLFQFFSVLHFYDYVVIGRRVAIRIMISRTLLVVNFGRLWLQSNLYWHHSNLYQLAFWTFFIATSGDFHR